MLTGGVRAGLGADGSDGGVGAYDCCASLNMLTQVASLGSTGSEAPGSPVQLLGSSWEAPAAGQRYPTPIARSLAPAAGHPTISPEFSLG